MVEVLVLKFNFYYIFIYKVIAKFKFYCHVCLINSVIRLSFKTYLKKKNFCVKF